MTWTIRNLDREDKWGLEDVVVGIFWTCEDFSVNGVRGRERGRIELSEPDVETFTAFEEISKAQAIEWVKEELGLERVIEIEASVEEQCSVIKPTQGMPWPADGE